VAEGRGPTCTYQTAETQATNNHSDIPQATNRQLAGKPKTRTSKQPQQRPTWIKQASKHACMYAGLQQAGKRGSNKKTKTGEEANQQGNEQRTKTQASMQTSKRASMQTRSAARQRAINAGNRQNPQAERPKSIGRAAVCTDFRSECTPQK